MLRSEALAELELEEGATEAEIEAAYRDLVKMWHPDQFSSDERRRQRTEQRLRRINEAYGTLEDSALKSGDLEPEEAAEEPVPQARVVGKTREKRKSSILSGWGYVWVAGLMGALAIYVTVQNNRTARQAAATKQTATAPAAAPSSASSQVPAASLPSQGPDMSGLTAGERTSVEHVCAAERQRSEAEFNRCATVQIAALAAVPARPGLAQALAKLSAKDRSGVERACSSAGDHKGPAAYDRCAARSVKTLAPAP